MLVRVGLHALALRRARLAVRGEDGFLQLAEHDAAAAIWVELLEELVKLEAARLDAERPERLGQLPLGHRAVCVLVQGAEEVNDASVMRLQERRELLRHARSRRPAQGAPIGV